MSDDEEALTPAQRKRRDILVTAWLAVSGTFLAVFCGWMWTEAYSLDGARDAHWLELPGGPAILVDGWSDGEDWRSFGFAVVDARTGDVVDTTWYGTQRSSILDAYSPRVVAAGGPRVAFMGEDGLHLRSLVSGEDLVKATLDRAFPQITAPWHQAVAAGPGRLWIEADDRRTWSLDLATGEVSATSERAPVAHYQRCFATFWDRPDGAHWTFVEAPTERHSDPNRWELASATPLEYGLLADVKPLGLRAPYTSFACDERTGRAGLFADGSALVRQGDVLGALGPDRAIRWTAPGLGLGGDMEMFGFDGGFVVQAGARLVSIGPGGEVRWSRDL